MIINLTEPRISVIQTNEDNTHTTFAISGLDNHIAYGYAAALRMVLYEQIPGYGVAGFRLLGAKNIMEVLPQYTEPMNIISLAIERARIKSKSNDRKVITLTYEGKVDGDLHLGDFKGEDVEILNPELRILTTAQSQQVSMEIVFALGIGYVREDENLSQTDKKAWGDNLIRTNIEFCPVTFVNFKVLEHTPIEDKHTLQIIIKTNGSMESKTALSIASQILISYLEPLTKLYTLTWDELPKENAKEEVKTELDQPIEILSLEPHTYNILKRDGAATLRDLKGIESRHYPHIVAQIVKALEEIGFTDVQLLSRK